MDKIELGMLTDIQISKGREMLIYMFIGRFGDRLSKDVIIEMKEQADKERQTINKLTNKLSNRLK